MVEVNKPSFTAPLRLFAGQWPSPRLHREPDSQSIPQRLEVEMNNDYSTLAMVALSTKLEEDSAVLDTRMPRHLLETTQSTQHGDYHLIYSQATIILTQRI